MKPNREHTSQGKRIFVDIFGAAQVTMHRFDPPRATGAGRPETIEKNTRI